MKKIMVIFITGLMIFNYGSVFACEIDDVVVTPQAFWDDFEQEEKVIPEEDAAFIKENPLAEYVWTNGENTDKGGKEFPAKEEWDNCDKTYNSGINVMLKKQYSNGNIFKYTQEYFKELNGVEVEKFEFYNYYDGQINIRDIMNFMPKDNSYENMMSLLDAIYERYDVYRAWFWAPGEDGITEVTDESAEQWKNFLATAYRPVVYEDLIKYVPDVFFDGREVFNPQSYPVDVPYELTKYPERLSRTNIIRVTLKESYSNPDKRIDETYFPELDVKAVHPYIYDNMYTVVFNQSSIDYIIEAVKLISKRPDILDVDYSYSRLTNSYGEAYGDVDGDSRFTASDVSMIYMAAINKDYKGPFAGSGDVDDDGEVTSNDAAEVMKKVLVCDYKFQVLQY